MNTLILKNLFKIINEAEDDSRMESSEIDASDLKGNYYRKGNI